MLTSSVPVVTCHRLHVTSNGAPRECHRGRHPDTEYFEALVTAPLVMLWLLITVIPNAQLCQDGPAVNELSPNPALPFLCKNRSRNVVNDKYLTSNWC